MDWLVFGGVVLKKGQPLSIDFFKKFFHLEPTLVGYVYNLIAFGCTPVHLLWTLNFLQTTTISIDQIATTLGTTRNTLIYHVYNTLSLLDSLLPSVCSFNFSLLSLSI